MRGSVCRLLRLKKFAALSIALATPLWAAGTQATQTRMTAQTQDTAGRTQAVLSIAVSGQDGAAATGAVVIQDGGRPVAGAALGADGTVKVAVDLLEGAHSLTAVYQGDASHAASASAKADVTAQTSGTPDFNLTVNPAALTLTAGQSGQITASLAPVNAASLTAPMFVTLSCGGLPDQSTCTFTPASVEILPNATGAVTSDLVITTQASGTRGMATPAGVPNAHPVAWAILVPGGLVLAGIGFGARRRRWLSRLSLLAFLGLVTMAGTTACAPRYNYYNHGPNYNLPTPSGTYTLEITAQSSNGVTATTHSVPFALTVQ